MRGSTVGRGYAGALFALAGRHGMHEEFGRALQDLTALLREPRARTFLESPKISVRTKKAVLARALEGRVPPLFRNFVFVVLDKRRERLFDDIEKQYEALLDEHSGRVHAQVTLARQLPAEAQREITDRLSEVIGRTVIPNVRVDGDILGGVIVRYGDHVLDGSLRRRLLALRNRLRQTAVPA